MKIYIFKQSRPLNQSWFKIYSYSYCLTVWLGNIHIVLRYKKFLNK